MIEEGTKQEIIMYGYRDSLALYDEGFTIGNLTELLSLYEDRELYLTCAGIKLAIDELTKEENDDSIRD
jgi:hypothetical protein